MAAPNCLCITLDPATPKPVPLKFALLDRALLRYHVRRRRAVYSKC